PQTPQEVPYADLKKKFYISFGLIFLGGIITAFSKPIGMLVVLIGFGYKVVAVMQTKNIAGSDKLLFNFIMSVVASFVGFIVFALAVGLSLKSVVSGLNISVVILYVLSVLIFILSIICSFRYYQEFADITGIKLFLYVFVLVMVSGIVDKLSNGLGVLLTLAAVGLELYAIYLINNISQSRYIYKIFGKEPKIIRSQIDENLEDFNRLNSNSSQI
ncbi:MAG: hypothetical protein J6W17_00035, partial [Campylobacter sp.]|nr:hypothetical protein [Campylobacter sp.]